MRHWIRSALVQIMACHLFRAKPLSKPMLPYRQLDSWEQISVIFESEFYHFHSQKCFWNCRLPIWWPFCPGGDELSPICSSFHVSVSHPYGSWHPNRQADNYRDQLFVVTPHYFHGNWPPGGGSQLALTWHNDLDLDSTQNTRDVFQQCSQI